MKVGRGYAQVVRTAGNITMNSTAWANTSTTLDLTLAASTGDVIRVELTAETQAEAVNNALNVVAVTGGEGWSTRTANTDAGVAGWFGRASVFTKVAGGISRTMASGDISGGNVVTRVRHRTLTAANKVLQATTTLPLYFQVRNHGPHVAP